MQRVQAVFRFYAELNDFLPRNKQQTEFNHTFLQSTAIKDILESLGVPHTEIDLILVDGKSVDFSYQPKANEHISIYPMFEALNISPLIKLRPKPLRQTRFILDVHLGKLAKYLRLLGFDTDYATDFSDAAIIQKALESKRIILTRDKGLLKNKKVTHGYWLREINPKKQIAEVINRFDLIKNCHPFKRCIECNGDILLVDDVNLILPNIPERVREKQNIFHQCQTCQRIYWQGTHYQKLLALIQVILKSQI